MGDLVSLSQFLDKSMIAKVNLNVRAYPSPVSPILFVVKKGDTIGRVYSWVSGRDKDGNKDSSYWFMYDNKFNGKTGYTKVDGSLYDLKALVSQGVKSVEQVNKEKEEKENPKTWYEKLFENLGSGAKKVLIGGAIVYVIVKLGETAILKKRA